MENIERIKMPKQIKFGFGTNSSSGGRFINKTVSKCRKEGMHIFIVSVGIIL
jgi:hypothetical protein